MGIVDEIHIMSSSLANMNYYKTTVSNLNLLANWKCDCVKRNAFRTNHAKQKQSKKKKTTKKEIVTICYGKDRQIVRSYRTQYTVYTTTTKNTHIYTHFMLIIKPSNRYSMSPHVEWPIRKVLKCMRENKIQFTFDQTGIALEYMYENLHRN